MYDTCMSLILTQGSLVFLSFISICLVRGGSEAEREREEKDEEVFSASTAVYQPHTPLTPAGDL